MLLKHVYQKIERWLVNFFCFGIAVYQKTLSPDHGVFRRPYGYCRFYPSCSQYAREALLRHGPWKGVWYTAKRLIKCNPFNAFGHDPVP